MPSLRKFLGKIVSPITESEKKKKKEALAPEIMTYLKKERPYGGTGEFLATSEEVPEPIKNPFDDEPEDSIDDVDDESWEEPPCELCGEEGDPFFSVAGHSFCSYECLDKYEKQHGTLESIEEGPQLQSYSDEIITMIRKILFANDFDSVSLTGTSKGGYIQVIKNPRDKRDYKIEITPIFNG